jgi:hypothetical protein
MVMMWYISTMHKKVHGAPLVDGISVRSVSGFTFSNVTANHTIPILFLLERASQQTSSKRMRTKSCGNLN